MAETPFKISIPQALLDRLQQKLALTTLPNELDGSGWDYGAPLADVKRLVARWMDGYDWRHHEAQLNQLPQFTRPISVDGHGTLDIHYIHRKSEVEGAIPLLFVHGWPGIFLEGSRIVPLLTAKLDDHPSFHVVVLSLPGFGFSEGAKKPGFNIAQYAEIGNKLMLALGYNEYVTQGGDWGLAVTRRIAQLYGGKHSKAWHTNMVFGEPPADFDPTTLTPEQQAALARTEGLMKKGMGYRHQQSTKPQTLAYAMTDSPVGLLAWIYEKLVAWTDRYNWTDIEVLTWISIFYFSREGPVGSFRIYYEAMGNETMAMQAFREAPAPEIPLGLSHFPGDLVVVPKSWSRMMGNVVFDSEVHDAGGHFPAYEQPEALAGDLRQMFGKGGPAYGVVPGKSGY
ncbi:alpha beta-hydrolase [Favolaschia claudopus]|uniref:Alpha beta-hydrolase n=1 Tax=Favolaschia claudopus TaxID=2862362 RepID=A0AAW0DQC7_9AGAR